MMETKEAATDIGRQTGGHGRQAAVDPGQARVVVEALLARLLGRQPGEREVELWSERLSRSGDAAAFLSMLLGWKKIADARPVPPGQPGSPLVDPERVRPYVEESRRAGNERGVAGIVLPLEAMDAFWAEHREVLAGVPFAGEGDGRLRYQPGGPNRYGLGDAALLWTVIHGRRPKRVVQVGSGASTAVLLDSLDAAGLAVRPVVIDPAAARLLSMLRPDDEGRLEIVAAPVQQEPLARFAGLEAGDILLLDTSHVLKTGSDVHHLLFHVLPVLRPGVLVQFGNCRFPFEYTDGQIFEKNWPWNEVYAVRALLMHSSRFRVFFSGSFFAARREQAVRATLPPFLRQPGAALWLEVADDGGPYGLAAVGGLAGFEARPAAGPATAPATAAEVNVTPQRDPGAPAGRRRQKVRTELAVGGASLAFNVLEGATGPVYFSLGVRKSGSTMLHKIVALLSRANKVNIVDVPGTFFKNGLTAADWARLDLAPLLLPGNIFTGFRNFPKTLSGSPAYRDGRKVFMHRDPRDAIVSQYFSDAFSHGLPEDSAGDGRQRFLEKRGEAQSSDIDTWVLKHAPSMARTLEMFAPTLEDPSCLVLPYETHVFEKRALIEKIVAHFGWTADAETVEAILAAVDVRPKAEDPKRFVRKATPGDHREKLKPETTAELDRVFATSLNLFGYA